MTETQTQTADLVDSFEIGTLDDDLELNITLLDDDTIMVEAMNDNAIASQATISIDKARELHARLGHLLYLADYAN